MTVRFGPVAGHRALRRFPIDGESPAMARRFTLATLATWKLAPLGDRAELLVSELVTNAVRHGSSLCLVELTASPPVVRVSVTDDGAGEPKVQRAGPDDVSGRGLAIVEALAERWGVEALPVGKRVWFELSPERATQGPT